jgi:hypothetical protein
MRHTESLPARTHEQQRALQVSAAIGDKLLNRHDLTAEDIATLKHVAQLQLDVHGSTGPSLEIVSNQPVAEPERHLANVA